MIPVDPLFQVVIDDNVDDLAGDGYTIPDDASALLVLDDSDGEDDRGGGGDAYFLPRSGQVVADAATPASGPATADGPWAHACHGVEFVPAGDDGGAAAGMADRRPVVATGHANAPLSARCVQIWLLSCSKTTTSCCRGRCWRTCLRR